MKTKQLFKTKRNISLYIGAGLMAFILVAAVFPQLFTHYDPTAQSMGSIMQPPGGAHPFGTDNFGRDIMSRVIYGTGIDLQIGFLAMIVPFLTGTLIGLIAGYCGGAVDAVFMRILDVFTAFPFIVLVIAIVSILGPNISNLYMAIWMVGWREYARLVRSEVLVERNSEFVMAAQSLGFSHTRILFRHILPNVIDSAVVYGISDIMMCMLMGASMSFLGLGVQAPTPEWGAIISDGRPFMTYAWWIATFPGIALAATGVSLSLLGEGLTAVLRSEGR